MLNPMMISARTEYVMLVMQAWIVTQKGSDAFFMDYISSVDRFFLIFNCSFSFWMVWQYKTTKLGIEFLVLAKNVQSYQKYFARRGGAGYSSNDK